MNVPPVSRSCSLMISRAFMVIRFIHDGVPLSHERGQACGNSPLPVAFKHISILAESSVVRGTSHDFVAHHHRVDSAARRRRRLLWIQPWILSGWWPRLFRYPCRPADLVRLVRSPPSLLLSGRSDVAVAKLRGLMKSASVQRVCGATDAQTFSMPGTSCHRSG
jgi:hypothetical protein